MNKMHYIYALTVAEQSKAIYIGVTANPKMRLSFHKSHSLRANTDKARWLREAMQNGQTPRLTILEAHKERESAYEQEIRLIAQARGVPGLTVLNMDDGGKPRFNVAHRPEHREKARLAIKQANSQHWEVTDPWGKVFMVTNMKQFCQERNLDCSTMSKVANGKQETHMGYRCVRLGKNPSKAA